MARALGVGGIFFKSHDPEALNRWYREALGIEVEPGAGAAFKPETMPPNGITNWSPFKESTTYFDPAQKEFMINFVVDDIEEALRQVAAAGGELVGAVEVSDYGSFGWFMDPERNKVELWQPA